MLKKLKKTFLKLVYRLLIFRIIIVDRENYKHYHKLDTFCEIELNTNKGPITFVFKENRQVKRRKYNKYSIVNNFLIELKTPDNLELKNEEITKKVIIVIKFILFKVNYEVLSEVLLDIYISKLLEHIIKNDKKKK